jgi:hypothetical protein
MVSFIDVHNASLFRRQLVSRFGESVNFIRVKDRIDTCVKIINRQKQRNEKRQKEDK